MTRRRGRPPLLDPVTERRRLLEAGMRILKRSGSGRITLDDVLAEARVSTRAFYRHFESINDLLVALRHDENVKVAAHLETVLESATDPVSALERCIDDLLAVGYEARRAIRVSAMRAIDVAQADARRECLDVIAAPVQRVIEQGVEDGVFAGDPAADASSIYSIILDIVGDAGTERQRLDFDEARAHVRRFALNALRATPNDATGDKGSSG